MALDIVIGDYRYYTQGGYNAYVTVKNRTKTSYENPLSVVTYGGETYYVRFMENCFMDCVNMIHPPEIPQGISDMGYAFANCTSLVEAPVIPSSVSNLSACFLNCTSLSGDVVVLGNSFSNTYIDWMFEDTILPITLYTYSDKSSYMAATANNSNVTASHISILPISSVSIKHNGKQRTRVDMVLDCTYGKYIVSNNGTLYNMNGDELQTGESVEQPSTLRCYGIYDTPQVPNSNMTISVKTISPNTNTAFVGQPSTATLAQIKQAGLTDPISPTIDVTNIRFNPEATGLNKYNVGDVIGITTTSMGKAQTNVDGDIKHVITHASNVKVSDTQTLQDWITEQYNNLT